LDTRYFKSNGFNLFDFEQH